VVVVPDATRATQLSDLLPVVLERLRQGGIPNEATVVLVATGTHPPSDEADVSGLTGPLPPCVRVVQHRCRTAEDLVVVGEHPSGGELRLNRLVVDSDFVVTVAAVRHHYIAGFGGGPKMLFPGVAGYDEIQATHARVFLPDEEGETSRDPRCEPGVLTGNPVAEEIAEAVDLRPPDLALSVVLGSDDRVAWAGAGEWRTSFSAAVEQVREWYELPGERHRLVVATGGGHPADASLIQAHKGLDAACRFLDHEGELLFVAEMNGGTGSEEMTPFLCDPQPEMIVERLAGRWVQYGHTTLRIVERTARHRVHLHSMFDADVAERLGFVPIADPDQVIERWRTTYAGETVAVMSGAAVYPRVEAHK
jgi:nickel-dependent lactate racemase